ncbi:hypothetical protein Tco_1059427, partial [Tanacetum coccineum]
MAKVAKSGKKKQPALGLETLSDIALTEAEQMKLAIERSKTQLHISQPSSSGTHKGTGVTPGVPDVPTYESNDEYISWKSSEEEDDDEENVSEHEDDDDDERTESDNDGDDFVHPKFSTHDDEAMQDEEVNEEDSFDPKVQTPSHVESTNDEDSDDEIHDANVEGDKMNEEETYAEDEANVLYGDVNINLEGRDTMMTDASLPNVTLLVDVPVTTIAEPPLVFATTLPPPPTPLITHMQQTPVPTPTIFKQTNQFTKVVSFIPGIVDAYLVNKMNEAVKTVVQLKSDKLRDEAQAENKDFLNSLDENIKKVIKDQVKQQVKAQVSKILPRIEKSALVEAYESDKLILDTYGDTVLFKKRRDDEDKDEEPSARSNRGSKRRQVGKEPESTSAPKEKTSKTTSKSTDGSKSQHKSAGESAHTEEPMHTDKDLEEPTHQEFDIGATEEHSDEETSQHPDWFQKPAKIPTPDRDWIKTLPAVHGPVQPWLSNLAREEGPRESFDELIDTPLDFSAFMMNQLKVDTLTPELLADMKGTCKNLVELEYFCEEVYKATMDQLDWNNPKGQQYPHDL